jgi:signal transduction histidine kinase
MQSEIIGSLASHIAHDLNVVLMAILSNADLLTLRTSTEDPRRSYIDEIRDAVTRGSGLARQLSAFKRPLHVTRVDVNRLIEPMTTLLDRLAGSDIAMVTRLSPGPIVISADAAQIEQMVLTLIVDARDAMPDGGRITIETSVAADPIVDGEVVPGEFLCVSVSDTRRDGRAARQGSLELAAVTAIAARHCGVVQVEHDDGWGSTFRVFLPRDESQKTRHVA